jgi:ribosomal protein L37AE/L43A
VPDDDGEQARAAARRSAQGVPARAGEAVIAKQKTVYYCEFCKKHGLSRNAMELHERVCTLNPNRTCRWNLKSGEHGEVDVPSLAGALHERAEAEGSLAQADIDWLRDEVDGCPACMLASLRQSLVEGFHWHGSDRIFDYTAEVERLRTEERELGREDMW